MLFEYFERLNTLRMSESDEILDSSNPRVLTDNASGVVKLCSAATWREETAFAGKPGDVYTACAEGDNVYEVFQEMYGGVLKQIEGTPKVTRKIVLDVKATFPAPECGTSILFRRRDEIYIARRHNNQKVTFNCVPINDEVREKFFADTKRAPSFRGTYYIGVGDEELYRKWDSYMHNQFALLYMDYKDKTTVQMEFKAV